MSRKNWLLIKLVLLVMIFLILVSMSLGTMSFSLFGRSGVETVQEQSFSNVEKIVVESISLPVDIYESDVREVRVTEKLTNYRPKAESPNVVTQEDGTLSIKQRKRNNMSLLSLRGGRIIIEVPKASGLEYDINSVSGSINHDAKSKDVLTASSISGSVRIYQGAERVIAKSTSGSVRIRASKETKEISASSVSGSVRIQLDNPSGYDMEYSTVSGSVKDTYKNLDFSKSGRATHGDSSLGIKASSVSGSIKLMDWDKEWWKGEKDV